MDYKTLLLILPPAVALSILVYLTRFLGKVITDQSPYADDRKWSIELYGLGYLINNLALNIIIGVFLAIYLPLTLSDSWCFIIISFILFNLVLVSSALTKKIFKVDSYILKLFTQNKRNREIFLEKYGNYINTILIPAFYVISTVFISKNIFWSSIMFCQLFFILFYSAYIYSLLIFKPIKADIYFIDNSTEPLKGISLLKINPDNIRLEINNKILILNKSIVAKIETEKITEEIQKPQA